MREIKMLERLQWKNMPDRSIYKDAERDAASDADFEEALELDSLASDDEDSHYRHDDSDVDSFFGSDISSDAQVDWLDIYYSWTALHIAARWGHDAIANLLLDHGAGVNHLARGLCDCCFAYDWTRKQPRFLSRPTPSWTPLHTAICSGN